MTSLLDARGISFWHGSRSILEEVSFAAGAGEFVALLGLNGAGKSTLLDVLAGLRTASAGAVYIAGKRQQHWEKQELARYVSHLPQSLGADLPFTAGQVVAMGRYPHTDRHFEGRHDHRLIDAAMQRTACANFTHRAFASLSGGERQRVLLAACLAQDASILLLDEPSTFLDVGAQLECFALLREEAERGRVCVAVTHDLNLALAHATRLLVLHEGRMVRDLSVASVAEEHDWLQLFSPRLRLGNVAEGTPRVWYA